MEGPFELYQSNAPLPMYARDQVWQDFYKHGVLGPRIVGEADIEAYDWDHQVLVLTPEASGRVRGKLGSFIAVLGEQRLYGGKGMDRLSQMAVRQPVIYTHTLNGQTLLFIRAEHDLGQTSDFETPSWKLITLPRIRDRFEALGKLSRPLQTQAFLGLRKKVCKLANLRGTATAKGLELDYSLTGARVGDYRITEGVLMSAGNHSVGLGPTGTKTLHLIAGTSLHHAVFPYSALTVYSGYQHEQFWTSGQTRAPHPSWVLSVWVQPIPEPSEVPMLGSVELLYLQQGGGGESVLADHQSCPLPVDWTKLGVKIVKP